MLPEASGTSSRSPHAAVRLMVPRRLAVVLAVVLAVLGVAGAGCAAPSGTSGDTSAHSPVIMSRTLPGVGAVLVTARGYALYMFAPDGRRKVTCTAGCAAAWPPVMLPAGTTPRAGPGVRAALLGSDPDPAGSQVVTYGGWPLYTYVGDARPGQATGQGLDMDGGLWYVLRPSGVPVESGP